MKNLLQTICVGLFCSLGIFFLIVQNGSATENPPNQNQQTFALLINVSNHAHKWQDLSSRSPKVSRLADLLQSRGVHVTRSSNPNKKQLQSTIDEFTKKISEPHNSVLFFFTGHTYVDQKGDACLISADTPLPTKETGLAKDSAISVKSILKTFKSSGIRRLFFAVDSSISVFERTSTSLEENIKTANNTSDSFGGLQVILGAGATGVAESVESSFANVFIQILEQKYLDSMDSIFLRSFCDSFINERTHNAWQIPWVQTFGDLSLLDEFIFLNNKQERELSHKEKKGLLLINPSPKNATIRILNIRPRYKETGMLLDPGDYKIEVSSKTLTKVTKWITLHPSETLLVNIHLNTLLPIEQHLNEQKTEVVLNEDNESGEINVNTENLMAPDNIGNLESHVLDKTSTEDTPTTISQETLSLGIKLIKIEKGSFLMGGKRYNEGPVHTETIEKDFFIMSTEVSSKQYSHFLQSTGKISNQTGSKYSSTLPAVRVSWQDAMNYAAWVSSTTGRKFRLPTEAEWEYAARLGKTSGYINSTLNDMSKGSVLPVTEAWGNQLGIYGMPGNVWEWSSDCWVERFDKRKEYKNSNCRNRTIRGGSWRDSKRLLTVTSRNGITIDTKTDNIGFRLVTTEE